MEITVDLKTLMNTVALDTIDSFSDNHLTIKLDTPDELLAEIHQITASISEKVTNNFKLDLTAAVVSEVTQQLQDNGIHINIEKKDK